MIIILSCNLNSYSHRSICDQNTPTGNKICIAEFTSTGKQPKNKHTERSSSNLQSRTALRKQNRSTAPVALSPRPRNNNARANIFWASGLENYSHFPCRTREKYSEVSERLFTAEKKRVSRLGAVAIR